MSKTSLCEHCGQPVMAVDVSVWYMHDNHTFTRLKGTLDEIVAEARRLGAESPYGMLGPPIVTDANGRDLRRIGDGIHARVGFAESDLLKWKETVSLDPDVVRLLGARP